MINLFRRYNPVNFLYLIPLVFLLSIGAFIRLPEDLRPVLVEPVLPNITGSFLEYMITPLASIIITIVITFAQALILNFIINKYNLLGKPSYLVALLYISLACMLTPFLTLSPALISNFLLIWMIDKLLLIYRRSEIKSVMYDLGLLVAVGTLFYFPFITMFILLWINLLLLRPFNWREWTAGIIGFLTIYFILFIIYLWLEKLYLFKNIWLPLTHPFPTSLSMDIYDYLVLIVPAIILILFIISVQRNFFKSVIHTRKSFQLFFFMLVLALGSFYLNSNQEEYHFLLCIPPLTIYMAYYFTHAKIRWLYEGVFTLLILTILYFQWY